MQGVAVLAASRRLLFVSVGLRPSRTRDAQLFYCFFELALYLSPLADAHEREKVVFASAAQRGHALALLLPHECPELEQPDEVRALVAKAGVELIGFLFETPWSLAWVLDGEPRRQHQHLGQTSVLGSRQD